MSALRVGFLCSEYPPHRGGGIGTFTRALGRGLTKAGARVDVVGLYSSAQDAVEDDEGVRVWRLRRAELPLTRFVRNGRALRQALERIQAAEGLDLVEGPENAFAAVGRVRGVRHVIRMHGGHHFFAVTLGRKPAFWRAWQEKQSFARADALCAVSRFVAETTRELLGLGNRHIEILPNFVDLEQFRPAAHIREEEDLIVYAGTLCEKKGIRYLVDAMPAILAARPRARLAVAGRDQLDPQSGGSYREFLLARMSDEVRCRVEFLGPVPHDQMPPLLQRASVCVYPSLMEAMPMAWLEGMAMGKAVVASRLGPGPEVIDDGANGLLCDPRQPEELAAQVVRLLRDPDLRASLGRQARQKVEKEFSAQAMLEKNIVFYRRVVERHQETE